MTIRAVLLPVAFWVVSLVVLRLAVVPPEACVDATPAEMRASAAAAARWIATNQLDDGRYTYEYNRETGVASPDYNIVRHAGVTASLYQAVGKASVPELLANADRGTDWMLDHLVRHDDWAALADEQSAPLGATALMAVALAERRLLTGDTQQDEVMRDLGRFMVAMQRADGGFHAYWNVETEEPDTVSESIFYPGEANWALALLHEALPEEGFDAAAWSALDWIVLERDQEAGVRLPPRRDHWSAYALGEMAEWGLEEHQIDYARGNAARLAATIRWEAQTESRIGQWFVAWRGGEARGAAFGTWVEGSSGLWRLAALDPRMADLRDDILERAACGAGILVERQVPADAPPIEAGAWFTDGVTRMDDQQHVISSLVYIADALEGDPRREPAPPGGFDRVSPVLAEPETDKWVAYYLLVPLGLIALLNPLGAASVAAGLPLGERRLAALSRRWWLAAMALFVAMALLAGPALDLLDISLPSWQLGASALVAVAVVRRLVQRHPFTPPLSDRTAPDWLAILWLTFWMATPAALGVVIVYALDLNRWISIVSAGLAVTIASLGALVGPALRQRLGPRRLRELARWTSLLALVLAVKLLLDGLNGV